MSAAAQTEKQDLKREVTLYNPYKPSLPDVKKRSFLPDINDTSKVRPDFNYDIKTMPYTPEYTMGPIKAASLFPDPLPKLYKSYIKLGFGTYFTPLAEVSITNERSKKGAIGLYARHFSTNGKIKLQNDMRKSLPVIWITMYLCSEKNSSGKTFLKDRLISTRKPGMLMVMIPALAGYDPEKKDIRMGYNNIGTRVSFESLNLDSASFSYDFDLNYDFFYDSIGHDISIIPDSTGIMAKTYKDFYVGSGVSFDYYRLPNSLYDKSKYIASVSPFIKKSSPQWNFKAGLQLLLDKNMTDICEIPSLSRCKFQLQHCSFICKVFCRTEWEA